MMPTIPGNLCVIASTKLILKIRLYVYINCFLKKFFILIFRKIKLIQKNRTIFITATLNILKIKTQIFGTKLNAGLYYLYDVSLPFARPFYNLQGTNFTTTHAVLRNYPITSLT